MIIAKDSFTNGKSGSVILNLLNFNELYLKLSQKNPEWNIEWFPLAPGVERYAGKYSGNGMAIPATSKNPERALMMIELFRNDQTYFDLTTYGIKGRNYELTADGKLTLPSGVTAANNGFPPDGPCPWGWRQDNFYRSYVNAWPSFDTTRKEMVKLHISSPLQAFLMNETSIKSELAAISSVQKQYEYPLLWGISDPVSGLATLKDEMKKAGMDKVMAEVGKQWGEFIKNK